MQINMLHPRLSIICLHQILKSLWMQKLMLNPMLAKICLAQLYQVLRTRQTHIYISYSKLYKNTAPSGIQNQTFKTIKSGTSDQTTTQLHLVLQTIQTESYMDQAVTKVILIFHTRQSHSFIQYSIQDKHTDKFCTKNQTKIQLHMKLRTRQILIYIQ